MGRGLFSEKEIAELVANPYVIDVDEKSVVYSNEFKLHFMEEYMRGKGPTQIFKDAGFDVKALGSKRIERACARWKESYQAGTLGQNNYTLKTTSALSRKKRQTSAVDQMESIKRDEIEVCRQQAGVIRKLKAENEMLKRINSLMLESGCKTPESQEICRTIRNMADENKCPGCIAHLCETVGVSRRTYSRDKV